MTYAIDWLKQRSIHSPNKRALIDTLSDREITYQEWNIQADQTAHFFKQQLDLRKGDRVAVLASNSVEYLDILFACNKTATVLQNVNWRLASPEIKKLLEHAQPKVLIYSSEFVDTVNEFRDCNPAFAPDIYVALGEKAQVSDVDFSLRAAESNTPFKMPSITWDAPWVLCYTGGSTGIPKGVILTHGNILHNAINTTVTWGLDCNDVAILNAPLFHVSGLNIFTTPLVHVAGCSIVCKAFDIDQVFDYVAESKATVFFSVPTVFISMQSHPRWDTTNFSHLKLVITGGASCPRPIMQKFWDKDTHFTVGYGLTEAGPNTFHLPKIQLQEKAGAVGYPLMHIDTKLIDDKGNSITSANTKGELLIRGPHTTPGYWNNPTATMKALDTNGWLHTGDLAMFDEDGAYTIVGRNKDMYISGGENVYPPEVENILFKHPEIEQAAVIGVPDDKWGEAGQAYVVLSEGSKLSEDEIRLFLTEQIAKYKIPKNIAFMDDLPKTAAGKLDKIQLYALYEKSNGDAE